jgi:predicted RNA-binding Zn-ribbon protein involved in translation (DUF1610 family)
MELREIGEFITCPKCVKGHVWRWKTSVMTINGVTTKKVSFLCNYCAEETEIEDKKLLNYITDKIFK